MTFGAPLAKNAFAPASSGEADWRGTVSLPDFFARIRRLRPSGEQATMVNRLLLAAVVLAATLVQMLSGDQTAQDFFHSGLPWLGAYVAAALCLQIHLLRRPNSFRLRRALSAFIDAAIVSYGLWQGGAAAGYLFPLYFWLILGHGVRFGPQAMGAAVAFSALGFGGVCFFSPFWRHNSALATGLTLSLVIIPLYGALLLRRAALARAEAERANHAKTLLLASVSHELRTPLTAIVGLGALLQKTPLDDEQRNMVQTLEGASGLLMRHIEALLSVSRDEMERRQKPPERLDLYALLISLRALLAVEAEKKGVRVGVCIDPETPRHIRAEPGLLLDILQNLGGNAVKFTAAGAVSIHVACRPRDADSVVLSVKVRDTGIGVEKAAQGRIFESFVQANPDISRQYGGSGLGLAIARRRLEACGGRIGVESDIGQGALFWFELTVGADATGAVSPETKTPSDQSRPPSLADLDGQSPQIGEPLCLIAPEPLDALALARRFALAARARPGDPGSLARARLVAAQMKAAAAAGAVETLKNPVVPCKILLAEDNGVNRMVLDKILTRAGHRTTLAADGEAAFNAMLSETFDVILMDVNMPGIGGVEAARLYQFAQPSAIRAPILALTADASAECRENCARAGMLACLTKPIDPDTLLAAVANAVRPEAPRGAEAVRKPETAGGVLDPSALKALAALGGEPFLRSLILEFVNEGALIVERMIAAVGARDQAAFQHEAHALSSSAGNLGAFELAGLCRSWKDLAPHEIARHGDDYLEDLRREWSLAALALGKILARRSATPSRKPVRRRREVA
jgi:two-component system sensor histidine kinase RpfC